MLSVTWASNQEVFPKEQPVPLVCMPRVCSSALPRTISLVQKGEKITMGKVVAFLFKIPRIQCDLEPCKMLDSMLCFYNDEINMFGEIYIFIKERNMADLGFQQFITSENVGRNDLRN